MLYRTALWIGFVLPTKQLLLMPLVAIQYRPGDLQLLDQRRLPLEESWLQIDGVSAAWTAIKDMAVRGAPAIAIAAALSLAVDLSQHRTWESGAAAVQHIREKLDYLVTRWFQKTQART